MTFCQKYGPVLADLAQYFGKTDIRIVFLHANWFLHPAEIETMGHGTTFGCPLPKQGWGRSVRPLFKWAQKCCVPAFLKLSTFTSAFCLYTARIYIYVFDSWNAHKKHDCRTRYREIFSPKTCNNKLFNQLNEMHSKF